MKILYLHQYFVSVNEPGATRSYEIARRLVARGHEVDLLTTTRNSQSGSTWTTSLVDGIRVHSVPVPYDNKMGFVDRVKAFTSFAHKARSYARSIEFDLVYATSTPLTIAWPAVKLSKERSVPMIFEVRDLWPEVPIAIGALRNPLLKRAAFRLESFAYNNAEVVISLSPSMTESITSRFPGVRVETIPNACDIELFAVEAERPPPPRLEALWRTEKPLISYIGSFGKANGVDYAVRIARELSVIAPDIRMLLIGAGAQWNEVRNLANELGLSEKSLFVREPIRKDEVPFVLQASDVALSLFVDLPVLSTNSANKFFDALASGTAVAINYSGWQKDLIESTGCGIVLPPDDPVEAANSLAHFVDDKLSVAQAGRRARELAETRFSRDTLVDKLATTLEEVHRTYHPNG